MISTSGIQMQNTLNDFIKNWEKLKSLWSQSVYWLFYHHFLIKCFFILLLLKQNQAKNIVNKHDIRRGEEIINSKLIIIFLVSSSIKNGFQIFKHFGSITFRKLNIDFGYHVSKGIKLTSDWHSFILDCYFLTILYIIIANNLNLMTIQMVYFSLKP